MPRPDERANRRAQPDGVRWRRSYPRQRYMHGSHVRRHPCGNSAARECQIRPSPCSKGRQTRRCRALRAVCRRGGLAASVGTAGQPVLADGNEVIPEVGKRGVAKVTAAMPCAAGSMPAGGLVVSTSTSGQPVLADGNEVIPGNGGDALRFARIVARPFRAVAHNGVRISPRLAAIIPYFPAAFNRPRCNPNFA